MALSNTSLWEKYSPSDQFMNRHIGPSSQEIRDMLDQIRVTDLGELVAETLPATIRNTINPDIFPPLNESQVMQRLRQTAAQNQVYLSLIGQGYYNTILPPVIQRNILENPAWYTAYTPYQPEISQGRLEALLNFQTIISELTGLPVANASLLDEATAAAEAMTMAHRISTSSSALFFVDEECHPQIISVLKTRAYGNGITLKIGNPFTDLNPADVYGALVQYPGTSGEIHDYRDIFARLHDVKAIACVCADPLALTLLVPPSHMGADIAVGSIQRFGLPLGYGGPHAGFMAVKDEHKRSMPGRVVGISVDSRGNKAFRLALQTREQHIRREKATSNICTAQALPAILSSMYVVWHGPEGLKAIAERVHGLTRILAFGLEYLGYTIENKVYFDTITVITGSKTSSIIQKARAQNINLRIFDDRIGISIDEICEPHHIQTLWSCFSDHPLLLETLENKIEVKDVIPLPFLRTDSFLTHNVFNEHHSETALLRYMRSLADKDLALDRTMIPLGSCTMKLNATIEMLPLTWPEFANLHPFIPQEQAQGYTAMLKDMEKRLCVLSGYDAISFQPNSGAQGEYAGLLAIRRFHEANQNFSRNVCLIPSSAHGTNPASAHMAGMKVVVVACDETGNVDVEDLKKKIVQHKDQLAAIMITYPSTHGVFEEAIREICDLVHAAGGQVYLDGANMNAQAGLAQPGHYGADVSHFNLHKTFCIPHGGGGPGMGPIGVKAHLIPYLPQAPHITGENAVSATEYGSASVLTISWIYMMLMGNSGLKRATKVAILNANYVAERLAPFYPILYRGAHGRVAHECIVDLRPIKQETGITVDDIAKRLMDFGFHAPTVSFPVAGTFMIEPTESENQAELDRFCEAMIVIHKEIADIRNGLIAAEASPLRHAPHTVRDISEPWDRPYTIAQGITPGPVMAQNKYWPPVNRVDNAYGDRNLVCVCPPLEAYTEASVK